MFEYLVHRLDYQEKEGDEFVVLSVVQLLICRKNTSNSNLYSLHVARVSFTMRQFAVAFRQSHHLTVLVILRSWRPISPLDTNNHLQS